MRLADFAAFYDFTYAQIDFPEVSIVASGFIGRNGSGSAETGSAGPLFRFRRSAPSDFFFRVTLRSREVKQGQIIFLVDRKEEEVEAGAFFPVNQQLVHIFEETALNRFQLFIGQVCAVDGFRNFIKFGIQVVKRIAVGFEIIREQGNFFFLGFGKSVVKCKIACLAQSIYAFGRALLKPELCPVYPVFELFAFIGCADFSKTVSSGMLKLTIEPNCTRCIVSVSIFLPLPLVIHNRSGIIACGILLDLVIHFVKLEILSQNPVVKAEVECLCGLGF